MRSKRDTKLLSGLNKALNMAVLIALLRVGKQSKTY